MDAENLSNTESLHSASQHHLRQEFTDMQKLMKVVGLSKSRHGSGM